MSFTAEYANRLVLEDVFFGERILDLYDYINYEPRWEPSEALEYLNAIPLFDPSSREFDFAFIDGDHSFEATYNNVLMTSKMMPNGGLIAVHDAISWPDVRPALQLLVADHTHLVFEEVLGEEFWLWCKQHHYLGQRDFNPNVLVDGIAVVRVSSST